MDNNIDPCDTMRTNLIAAAVGLQQCTKTAANIVPIPGGDRVIVIGTPAQVAQLLPTATGLTAQQVDKLLFAADILDGVDCEDTAGDLRDIARGAA